LPHPPEDDDDDQQKDEEKYDYDNVDRHCPGPLLPKAPSSRQSLAMSMKAEDLPKPLAPIRHS
jgi:hypothetical protein